MMSKAPRWPEVLVNSKIPKPAQKKGAKEASSLTAPVFSRGKQAGSSAPKATLNGGGRSGGGGEKDCKAGVTLKRSSHQGRGGHWASRPPSTRPSRPALQLCSSRSFSSLDTSSLTTVPFMRSSHSLNRLDRRATADDSDAEANSPVRKETRSGNKILIGGKLSSQEPVRTHKELCHEDNEEKKQMSSSCETLKSSFELSSTNCPQQDDSVEQESKGRDHSLFTTRIRRNLIQTVMKNVSSAPVAASTQLQLNNKDDPESGHQNNRLQEDACREGAEDPEKPKEEESQRQQKMAETSAAISSASSPSPSPTSSPRTDSPSHFSPTRQAGEVASPYSPSRAMLSKEDGSDQECRPSESERGQLVQELGQTQKELSRLQQLNRKLQHELQQERESHLREKNDLLFNSNLPSEPASTLRRLHETNHQLRVELEAQKRMQEEAREAELRQRVDLLAQQAQLLVTGDATALAQARLEQERRWFHEQQMEWRRSVTSLKTQLSFSEEKRKESELRTTRLQEESYGHRAVREEAEELRKALREAATQLRTTEEAQAQKESLLQKHLTLLQASQGRERQRLSASLASAEQHSRELQERLDGAERRVDSLNKAQMWCRDLEDTRQQLQEELASSRAAEQKYRDEKEQTEQQCQELRDHVAEAQGEISRLQGCLKTLETHYRDLQHSYESISEELLAVLEKAQQREAEAEEMRDGFERLLDTKERELNEVLLKMEVLGNSLEEKEAQFNEMLKVCTCASSHVEDESLEAEPHTEVMAEEPHLKDDGGSEERGTFSVQNSPRHARVRSHSLGPSHQYIIASGDDPQRFTTAIQLLETKLFVTEEKLREITERLEEHRDHKTCPHPHLDSRLAPSRGSARHLALLLHSRAEQSQRFAQETENLCGLLAGRFQFALNVIRNCRERIQTSAGIELTDFVDRLSAVETCLRQGQNDAEKQQRASFRASKVEDESPDDVLAGTDRSIDAEVELAGTARSEDIMTVGVCLMRELVIVEKILAALKKPNEQFQFLVAREDGMTLAHRYQVITSQILSLKKTPLEEGGAGEDHQIIMRACTEAELIYAAFKIQQQYPKGPADSSHPTFVSYEERETGKDAVFEKTATSLQPEDIRDEKRPPWFERLLARLQRRAKVMWLLSQEVTCMEENWEPASGVDTGWMLEQAKLVYLSDRLYLDLEQEQRRCVMLQDNLQALRKQRDASLTDERRAFQHTLCELREDNRALREELEHAEEQIISMETGNQRLQENKQRIEDYHKERLQKLQAEFQMKMKERQKIHRAAMKRLNQPGMKDSVSKEEHAANLKDNGDASPTEQQEVGPNDVNTHQVFCGGPLEEMHRKSIAELQRQHDKQVEELLQEKERLMQEETAATLASITAMRRAHKDDLENVREPQHVLENDDITQIHSDYQKAMESLSKELEELSFQHTQKCLENSKLRAELQFERKSIWKQRESPERKPEQDKMHTLSQSKMKDFSKNNHNEPHQDVTAQSQDVRFATLPSGKVAPGEKNDVNAVNSSHAALVKKSDKPSLLRRLRALRSKSLKEGISGPERMKLLDSTEK
ncbi:trichohyalin [Hippocampus comes]|uniref:trichohyalin n=1 Tax=Hippocampus comes TaxID=109280 RepID=UPI00094E6911|nr:PREDICTED: trichohyalin-like [Hippocampus comes]